MGLSNGAYFAELIGCENQDVFSRLGLMTPIPGKYSACSDTVRPPAARAPIYLSMGVGEPDAVVRSILNMVPAIRKDGRALRLVLDLRVHVNRRQDYGNVFQWLADTWASPRAAEPTSVAASDTALALTPAVLAKMTDFWTGFRVGHPIRDLQMMADTWPMEHRKTATVPVGMEQMTAFDMIDLRATGAKAPSVAAGLKKVGLTFRQEEAYRSAFIGARSTLQTQKADTALTTQAIRTIPSVERNIQFLIANNSAVGRLLNLMAVP